MKAVALVAPVLVLGLLHVLAKLEAWTVGDSARGLAPYVKGMSPPVLRREEYRAMGEVPLPTTGEPVRLPVPRDPPPPPGYVDPLEGSRALDDLVATDRPAADPEPPARTSE